MDNKSPSTLQLETLIKETTQTVSPSQKYLKYQNEVLGVGSFKRVFKCLNVCDGKEYAWNEVGLEKLEPVTATKVFQEIAMYKQCNHPNIIKIFDCWFNDDNLLIFTTELIHGGSLYQFIHKVVPAIRLQVIQRWALQILDALAYLHSISIIHRDLKSQNIFIDYTSGTIKIGDLGLATCTYLTEIEVDKSKQSMVGTSEFMAPEIYTQKYDEKIDVYSFGHVMIELATKEFPYSECKHTMEIYHRVTQGIQPEALKKITNKQLNDLVTKATLMDPLQRPHAKQLIQHEFFTTIFTDEAIQAQPKDNQGPKKSSVLSSPNVVIDQLDMKQSLKNQGFQMNQASQAQIAIQQPQQIDSHSPINPKVTIKITKKVCNDPETFMLQIICQINQNPVKSQMPASKNDKPDNLVKELIHLKGEFEPLKNELNQVVGKVFDQWNTTGVSVDSFFVL
ncbi:Kinase [Hexamita inflata]|uniref:Kinase n=1 Tax=Hexamita inflata TaxID=28002 RepID=A0AA86P3M7_9EUKA|nr:Kinase [Hexamita inflata]